MIPSWEGNKGIENDAANKIRDSPRQYYYGNGIELAQKRESMAWLFTQSKEILIQKGSTLGITKLDEHFSSAS